jgi:hypothetical protein
MITCRELVELLSDFAAGQLPPEDREHIEQHLGLCSYCVAYLGSYHLTIQMTRQLPNLPLPPDLERQLRALLAEGQRNQSVEDQGSVRGEW